MKNLILLVTLLLTGCDQVAQSSPALKQVSAGAGVEFVDLGLDGILVLNDRARGMTCWIVNHSYRGAMDCISSGELNHSSGGAVSLTKPDRRVSVLVDGQRGATCWIYGDAYSGSIKCFTNE